MNEITKAFTDVYTRNVWGRKDTSGHGSAVKYTKAYVTYLATVLNKFEVRCVLDIGCGIWEHLLQITWTGIDYLGIDAVPSVIEKNESLNLASNIRFRCGTLETLTIAPTDYDLVIIKDVFQHLPNALILDILERVKNVPLLLITNDISQADNTDCLLGGFRKLDMERSPFNLIPDEAVSFQSYPFIKRSILVRKKVDNPTHIS